MFKSRRRIAEEEAKKEENYIPTEELMSDDDKANPSGGKIEFPLIPAIIMGVLALAIIACIIVIIATGGPVA